MNLFFRLSLICFVSFVCLACVNAQDVLSPEIVAASSMPFLESLILRFPFMTYLFLAMGSARAVFKLIYTVLGKIAPMTETKADDKALGVIGKILENKIISFIFDYFFSIKTKIKTRKV